MKHRLVAFLLLLFVSTVASSCRGAAPTAIDRQFVAEMIPHHHLGMELIDQATRHVDDTRVRRLVFEMSNYHVTELEQLHEWSAQWNVVPVTDFPGHIDTARMSELAGLKGVDYDLRWLMLMIEHHKGAIEIAERQLKSGTKPRAIEMARSVEEVQSREVDEMSVLLESLVSGG